MSPKSYAFLWVLFAMSAGILKCVYVDMAQLKEVHESKGMYQENDQVFASTAGTQSNTETSIAGISRRSSNSLMHGLKRQTKAKPTCCPPLPSIRLYDLRHTATTLMQIAGVNLKVISLAMRPPSSP